MSTVKRVSFLASNTAVCHFTVIKKRAVQTGSCAAFRCLLTLQLTNNTMTLSCPSADPTSQHEVSPYDKLFTSTSTTHAHLSVSEPPPSGWEGSNAFSSVFQNKTKVQLSRAASVSSHDPLLSPHPPRPSSGGEGEEGGGETLYSQTAL